MVDGGVFGQDLSPSMTLYPYYNAAFQSAQGIGYAGAVASTISTFPAIYMVPLSQQTNGFIIRFRSDSSKLVFGVKDSGVDFGLMVDGQLVSSVYRAAPSSGAGGNCLMYTFNFATQQMREFQILANAFVFNGIWVNTGSSILQSPDTGLSQSPNAVQQAGYRAVFMGDSIGEGATSSLNFTVGRLLGWTTWNVPWGGTGYIADASGTRSNFYGRYSDITQAQPQIVVISGGINDNGYIASDNGANFTYKVNQLFSRVATDFPNAIKIAVSPFWPRSGAVAEIPPEIILERDIIQAKAAQYNFRFIDWLGWITGQQNIPNSGNANVYISADNTHPTGEGRNYLGARLAMAIARSLNQPVPGGLDSLTLSSGSLSPAYDPLVQNYEVSVPYAVSSLALTPTASYPGTTVQTKVNSGSYVATPLSSATSMPLNVGSNLVDVQVTGNNGMITTHYSLNVTRAAPSNDANLSALSLSGTGFTPSFTPSTTSYSANVANDVSELSLTPTAADAGASILVRINGGSFVPVASGSASAPLALAAGANSIDVQVTAQDGVTVKTYSISVSRMALGSNANLSSLTIDPATLSPAFDALTTSYSGTVDNAVTAVTVTPTTEDPTASFSVSGASGLVVGSNTVTVRVTAQNGSTTNDYLVTINRLALQPFDLWKQANFGDQANNPAVAGDLADPAGDGVPNILKYALGLDPRTAASADSLPTKGLEGAQLTLTYTKIKSATDISYQVVWSPNLISWSQDGITESVVPGSDTPTSQKIKATAPSSGARQQLIRLKVSRLPSVP
jgi:lysophospholipase L1-like esterase